MKRTTILRAILLCTLLCARPASASLIAAWHFDEPAGVIATPAVGSVTGALQGSATFAPGQGIAGGAVRLTTGAANSLVNFGNNFSFPGTSNFSILAWIKTDTSDTAFLLPVGKHNGGSANGYFLIVNDTSDGTAANRARFFVTGVNTPNPPSSSTTANGTNWSARIVTLAQAPTCNRSTLMASSSPPSPFSIP
ncbi:MAG: type 1 secretion C-terminal target domain subclass [Phycisphaerales bacterium]|nr:type 1 secretion C-terminal target domain subclass [Phycisphaerales bacterium]